MQIKSVFEIQFYSSVLLRLKFVTLTLKFVLSDKYTGSRQPYLWLGAILIWCLHGKWFGFIYQNLKLHVP